MSSSGTPGTSYEEPLKLLERDLDGADSSKGKGRSKSPSNVGQKQSKAESAPKQHVKGAQQPKGQQQGIKGQQSSKGGPKGGNAQSMPGKGDKSQTAQGTRSAKGQQTQRHHNPNTQFDDPQKRKKASKQQVVQLKFSEKQVELFSHLPQYERPESISLSVKSSDLIHPAVLNLGIKYSDRVIIGSTARCLAMLDAFCEVVRDYKADSSKSIAIDFEWKLRPLIQFLSDCRPLSIGMGNAIKSFKRMIGRIGAMKEEEAKEFLIRELQSYKESKIIQAGHMIVDNAVDKIQNDDVVLTFAYSNIVTKILLQAAETKQFRVVVVDSSPMFEGKKLVLELAKTISDIHCTYVLLTGISRVLGDVSKVFLGAHGLLSNGTVISRAALVAMMAHAENIPVLVCCETYKFHERVQLDAFTFNELSDPSGLLGAEKNTELHSGLLEDPKLKLLNLAYDITPLEHVSVVVTEVGLIPPTSVPVVIREAQQKTETDESEQKFSS